MTNLEKLTNKRSKICLVLFVITLIYLTISSFTRGVKRDLDYKVFYKVSQRVNQGDLDIYNFKKDGIFSYKYSPFAAIIFKPLSLVKLETSQALWCFFNAISFILAFWLSWKILVHYIGEQKYQNEIFLLTLIAIARPVLNNAMQANINMYLYLLMIISVYLSVIKNRVYLASIPLAFAAAIKIVPLSLIGFYLFSKRFKTFISTILFTIALSTIPFLYFGVDETIQLFKNWATILADKNHDPYFKWTNQSGYVVWFHILKDDALAIIIHRLHLVISLFVFLYLVFKKSEIYFLSFCFVAILFVSPVVRIEYYVMLIFPAMLLNADLMSSNRPLWKSLYWLRFVICYFLGKFLIGRENAELVSYYGQMYWGLILFIILMLLKEQRDSSKA